MLARSELSTANAFIAVESTRTAQRARENPWFALKKPARRPTTS
jgi:hypothetical protein